MRRSVKDLLRRLRREANLLVDLAVYSLAYGDKHAALEALRLEGSIDRGFKDLVATVSLAVRSPEQASIAEAAVEVAAALDEASNASGDLALLVIKGYPASDYVATAALCCGEAVAPLRAERRLSLPPHVDVLLLRRGGRSLLAPRASELEPGDEAVIRGSAEVVMELAPTPPGKPSMYAAEMMLAGDDVVHGLAEAKALARSGFDAALYSLVAGDRGLARAVMEMEEQVDSIFYGLLEDVLGLLPPTGTREALSTLVFAMSVESLSDAAARIAGLVVEETSHTLSFIGETVEDEEEAYMLLEYHGGRATLEKLGLGELGLIVVAAKRGGRWVIPFRDTDVSGGDMLLVKSYSGAPRDTLNELEARGLRVAAGAPR